MFFEKFTKRYFMGIINSPSESEAREILETILRERLIAGGTITKAKSIYKWKGNIEDEDYYSITVYTNSRNRRKIIDAVRKISVEELPLVIFSRINSDRKIYEWIKKNTNPY